MSKKNKPTTKYDTNVKPRLGEIEAWAYDGLTDKEIADRLGVCSAGFKNYKRNNPELAEALKHGKDYVDKVVVVGAYLKRIVGYDVVEVKNTFKITEDENGNKVKTLTGTVEQSRHIPGDPRAAEFWLAHRQPELWSNVPKSDECMDGLGVIELPATVPESAAPEVDSDE